MRRIFPKQNAPFLMPGIQAVFLLCWLMNHTGTDSFHNVYSLCALLGLCCLYDNFRSGAGQTYRMAQKEGLKIYNVYDVLGMKT